MKLVAALVFALAAVGCSSPAEDADVQVTLESAPRPVVARPARVWRVIVDPSVDDGRLALIVDAFEEWEAAVPCLTSVSIVRAEVTSATPPAGTITMTMAAALPVAENGPAVGWANWDTTDSGSDGSRVRFLEGGPMWFFPTTALHEIGHAFRLPHDDVNPSIVGARVQSETVTEHDAAAYAARWCR